MEGECKRLIYYFTIYGLHLVFLFFFYHLIVICQNKRKEAVFLFGIQPKYQIYT